MFVALARTGKQHVGEFIAQGLANMVWAIATTDRADELLFMVFSVAAERHLGNFNA